MEHSFATNSVRRAETLCHRENLEFLSGLRGVFGVHFNAGSIEAALSEWVPGQSLHVILERWEAERRWVSGSRWIPSESLFVGMRCDKVCFSVYRDRAGEAWADHLACIAEVVVPLGPMLIGSGGLSDKYVLYAHTFTPLSPIGETFVNGANAGSGLTYIGITRRGWAARYGEHRHAANTGSPYRFHEAIRRCAQSHISVHQVLGCGLTLEEAMDAEERLVAGLSLYPKGLNMIPGGHAGIAYLAKHGFKATRKDWENRERVLRRFSTHCDRSGKPNPLAAALWRDDAYAASVICSNPHNFTLEQVREARYLESLGWETSALAERYGCSGERISRLIDGRTYSRVH